MSKTESTSLSKMTGVNSESDSIRTAIPKEIADVSGPRSHNVLICRIDEKANELVIKGTVDYE